MHEGLSSVIGDLRQRADSAIDAYRNTRELVAKGNWSCVVPRAVRASDPQRYLRKAMRRSEDNPAIIIERVVRWSLTPARAYDAMQQRISNHLPLPGLDSIAEKAAPIVLGLVVLATPEYEYDRICGSGPKYGYMQKEHRPTTDDENQRE